MSYPPQPPQQPPQPPQYQQPAQYQQGQYQQPYGQYQAPVQPKNNTLALVGFWMAVACVVLVWTPVALLAWLMNLAAFIICIIANGQIKKSQGQMTGKGFAVAGIVISSVLFGLFVIIALVAGAFLATIIGGMGGL
ncbi:MAG TPA: hypothetical protein VNT01_01415 [Symbiobacteriaceae bacterium]|nr:hypothetical protein [Symbiobacteriaceae bacterium]